MDNTIIGIDVSKAKLDICFLSSGEVITLSNDKEGFAKLLKTIKNNYQVESIIIEHTGNYQKGVVDYLQSNKLKVCVVNPNTVRHFAKASGILAKTDKIDAYVLAKYGEMFNPEERGNRNINIYKLKELVNFRNQLVETIKQFKTRLEKKPSSFIVKEIVKSISSLAKQQNKIEEQIKILVQNNKDMFSKYNTLNKIKGFGEQTIAVLLSHLPELGELERKK